jgi:hypothetical protein
MSKHKHSVKSHIWRGGILTVFEEFFDSLEHALHYSRHSGAQTTKIYHVDSGELVHSASNTGPSASETYA